MSLTKRWYQSIQRFCWQRYPQWMPMEYQRHIFERSPYVCVQLGQGSPMIVMRREVFEAGEYGEVDGAPLNRAGELWILKQWLKDHPTLEFPSTKS